MNKKGYNQMEISLGEVANVVLDDNTPTNNTPTATPTHTHTPTSTHTRTYYGVAESTPKRADRDIGNVVANVRDTINTVLAVISCILGLLVVASGAILCYQGVVAAPVFNYVLFVFAGIDFVAGFYIIVRVFNIQSMISQLKSVNASLENVQSKLKADVGELQQANEKLDKLNHSLDETSAELRSQVDKLRLAIAAIVQANDSSIELGAVVKVILEDISRERDKITTERQAAELFTTRLSEIVFAEMDANHDGVVDRAEQTVWLSRIRA